MSDDLKIPSTVVPLFQGDDLDPIADRAKQVESKARTASTPRLGDPDPLAQVAENYDEFLAGALERAVKVGLAALPRKPFRALMDKHPARMVEVEADDGQDVEVEVHEDDEPYGFNFATLGDDLIPACMVAYWEDFDEQVAAAEAAGTEVPVANARRFVDIDEAQRFLDRRSDGEFSKLFNAALRLNRGAGPDPKVRLSSLLEQTSDGTSDSPDRLA